MLPQFYSYRDKLNHSELALNNGKLKHLVVRNPNYFINVRERKESSSSNHTDNEDSNNEDIYSGSQQFETFRKVKQRFKDKKYYSYDVMFSSEDSKDLEETPNSDEAGDFDIVLKKSKKLKLKQKKKKSLSLWCLQKADQDYNILETITRKKNVTRLSDSSDVAEILDDVVIRKSRRKEKGLKCGNGILLREDIDDNTDSDTNVKEPKFNRQLLARLKAEKSQFWKSSSELKTQPLGDKPSFWRQSSAETGVLAVDALKFPSNIDECKKTLSKKLFMNLKLSWFGQTERSEKSIIAGPRPIVFGGTFPIDMPLGGNTRNRIVLEKDVPNKVLPMSEVRTFEIDVPINEDKSNLDMVCCDGFEEQGVESSADSEVSLPHLRTKSPKETTSPI